MTSNVTELPLAGRLDPAPQTAGMREAIERAAEARRRALRVAGVLSAVWLLVCAAYAFAYVGAGALAALAPHQAAMAVTGVATPLAVLGLVVLFLHRGGELREHTEMFTTVSAPEELFDALARMPAPHIRADASQF